MKENGSPNFNTGDKRGKPRTNAFVVTLIIVLVLAALPLSAVFAAPTGPNNNTNQDSWNQKVQNLRADMAVSKNIVTIPGNAADSQQQRWLNLYMADLRAAQALAAGRFFTGNATTSGTTSGTSSSTTNGNAANGIGVSKYYQSHPDKLLAWYLHQMRILRAKLGLSACSNNSNRGTNGGNNNGVIACFGTGLSTGTTTGTSTGTGTTTGTGTGTGSGAATATPVPSATPSTTPTP